MRNQNPNEHDVMFTQDLLDSINTDKTLQLVKDPAFTDADGNIKVVDRVLATPVGYKPESTDDNTIAQEAKEIVKYELSNNITTDVAYLLKYCYIIDEHTNEMKVVIHGKY